MKKILVKIAVALAVIVSFSGAAMMTINNHVVQQGKKNLVYIEKGRDFTPAKEDLDKLQSFNADCIMVLGAGIRNRETPSSMLKDRLDTGVGLYKRGVAPKLLLSGDNGDISHNEIHVMLNYALKEGVPKEDIFCDHAGFSTYDSVYRGRSIFQVKKMIIVTQSYHEYRALYIGGKLGVKVLGAASDQATYTGQPAREIREVLARVKDFFKCIKKPGPLLGGEAIPISGSGVVSHGE